MASDLLKCKREDEVYCQKFGKRKAFHVGGNSSCRAHIRSHYALYELRCGEQNIAENHHAVPRDIPVQERKRKKQLEGSDQPTLDNMFHRVAGPRSFSREEVLKCVAQFVVCNDQVRAQSEILYYRDY